MSMHPLTSLAVAVLHNVFLLNFHKVFWANLQLFEILFPIDFTFLYSLNYFLFDSRQLCCFCNFRHASHGFSSFVVEIYIPKPNPKQP